MAAAALLVGGGLAAGSVSASADTDLPERSAGELLVDVQEARLSGLSGTIVQTADLGLPDLPGVGGSGSSELSSLVAGTHTMKVWYAGPDKSRLALLGNLGESDVIRNGDEAWIWNSKKNTAVHYQAPDGKAAPEKKPTDVPQTPQEAADAALEALDPSTTVTATDDAKVAGRSAYELVLTPRDDASLVKEVRIAIDGVKHIPTRVQVLADDQAEPAFEIGFTDVNFTRPDDAQFEFNPPPGAEVTEAKPEDHKADKKPEKKDTGRKVVGEGWTSVIIQPMPESEAPADRGRGGGDLQSTLEALPKVSGDWGSGRLLEGTLFSVLITDDNTVVAGAVAPEALYAALGSR